MTAIQPTSGMKGTIWTAPVKGLQGGKQSQEAGFGKALKTLIDKVDGDQRSSAAAIQDLITGKNKDILPVVQAVAKADLSFKLLMGIRNKVIEAYQQTMRMQI